MSNHLRFPRQLFFLCLGLLAYFLLLMAANYYRWDFVLIGVFVELLTIPALLAVIGLSCYSVYALFREVGERRRWHGYSLGVLSLTIVLLVWVTLSGVPDGLTN